MNASIKCNHKTQMYTLSSGGHYGFDFILNTCLEIVDQFKSKLTKSVNKSIDPELDALMVKADSLTELRGTETLFNIYKVLIGAAGKVKLDTFFHHQTPVKVRRILEKARKSDRKLRIFLGDSCTGRDWLEENDVMGTIGRSSGVLKVPLLLSEDDIGGPSLLDHCILRIIDCDTNKELYRASNYQQPDLVISDVPHSNDLFEKGFTHSVINRQDDSNPHAHCRSYVEACSLIAFLNGASMTPVR